MQSRTKKVAHIKTQIDDLGRKKFTIEDHQSSSNQPNQKIINTGERHQSTLIARQQSLNIEKYIGKLPQNKKKIKTQVFHCDVCEEGFKCDLAYITHLNSPMHNRKLGMNMKVKAVTLDAVTTKLETLRKIKNHSKQDQKLNKIIQKYGDSKIEKSDEQPYKQQPIPKEQQIIIPPSTLQQNQSENQQQLLMKQYGLPTSFASKKIKR